MSDDEMSAPTGPGEIDMESNYPLEDMGSFDPQEVGTERDVSAAKDGGVVKKLLVRGEGFKVPEKGDEVTGAWPARRRRALSGFGSTFSRSFRRPACGV